MFSNFFSSFNQHKKWFLTPLKYPKGAKENYSSKVLLPYSILRDLATLNYQPPYVFEISHENEMLRTVCSVADFALDRKEAHIPSWMFEQLCLEDCSEVILAHTKVDRGQGIKLLPHSVDFLEVENPRAELEKGLLDYHVLTHGDEILLAFEDQGNMRFTVTQITPEDLESIYLVDTDLNVDFDEPIGYRRKLEDEKTVMKYVEAGEERDGIRSLQMKRVGFFLDWDSLQEKQ